MPTVIKHSFSNVPPTTSELMIGELALSLYWDETVNQNIGILYTKSLEGNIVAIGKGVTKFEELEDVDLTNLKEGSFIIRQGNKFIATNFIGNLSSLTDVEIVNPQMGDYIRYDPTFESFRNFKPSYNLYQLLDTEVPNPNLTTSANQTNYSMYYDHPSGKFKLRPRINQLAQLDDVQLNTPNTFQILSLDADGKWKNIPLQISRDPNPTLGNSLNANSFSINNSAYRVQQVTANTSTATLSYASGDYWIINGVPSSTNPQCILIPDFSSLRLNSTAVMMLEIRQSTGAILIGGLQNTRYEDGKPIQLSGNGKVDLITITVQSLPTSGTDPTPIITSYVTATALNLAASGLGGLPAYRYDKNRYPDVQQFDIPNLYDSYFEYVELLLNFEPEQVTGKTWIADKSDYDHTVTTTATQKAIPVYTYGIQEYVAEFQATNNTINISVSSTISLAGDFTLELFVNHPTDDQYISSTSQDHILFENQDATISIKYIGSVDTSQSTKLRVKIGSRIYLFENAYNYFSNKNNQYVHIAIVRQGTAISTYIQGIYQNPVSYVSDSPVTTLIMTAASITNFKGLLNSVRLTEYPRYTANFTVPNMRFGLVGGANDILEAQVFDNYWQLDREFEYEMFC